MNFEPNKFFIGLIDFFSIILPGALATFLLTHYPPFDLPGVLPSHPIDASGWLAFLFASYLIGHLIFLLGSMILDDWVYDPIRTALEEEQIARLARGEKPPLKLTRWLANALIKKSKRSRKVVRRAEIIKQHYLDPLAADATINAFQWCKLRLAREAPEALAMVERFEADSKFFRSFVVVLAGSLLVGLLWALFHDAFDVNVLIAGAIALLLIGLAFWRYFEQRMKATRQAYWAVITLESRLDGGYRAQRATRPAVTHAGGVVCKGRQYLLVHAKRDRTEWVLPKGHVEPEEEPAETAVREVHEETGVWARRGEELGVSAYDLDGSRVAVQFYAMRMVSEDQPEDRVRDHDWFTFTNALSALKHRESRRILRAARKNKRKGRSRTTPRAMARHSHPPAGALTPD